MTACIRKRWPAGGPAACLALAGGAYRGWPGFRRRRCMCLAIWWLYQLQRGGGCAVRLRLISMLVYSRSCYCDCFYPILLLIIPPPWSPLIPVHSSHRDGRDWVHPRQLPDAICQVQLHDPLLQTWQIRGGDRGVWFSSEREVALQPRMHPPGRDGSFSAGITLTVGPDWAPCIRVSLQLFLT
ncbi:uncharacterized protein BO80DRAFT_267633 [Aspergillus ibericus CBS 121593]|uniref:Uncharacterized protein n=1 Tax=Aspergillus ibericus CBS 121593 TaxID=1448316 RepID=A0A395H6X8_9EURO|nr:hypothetical protein BO80DRAFT_267633 [Aspergillus ibericus CBS 121593]RAL03691.1 hypothetical protein BO80DRAFT_267633 [Aspergillus ibericus CBS 121593]